MVTVPTASTNSPQNSFGSTPYRLNVENIVTGSVADKVVPNMRHSTRWIFERLDAEEGVDVNEEAMNGCACVRTPDEMGW
jgi:hypothetical protein